MAIALTLALDSGQSLRAGEYIPLRLRTPASDIEVAARPLYCPDPEGGLDPIVCNRITARLQPGVSWESLRDALAADGFQPVLTWTTSGVENVSLVFFEQTIDSALSRAVNIEGVDTVALVYGLSPTDLSGEGQRSAFAVVATVPGLGGMTARLQSGDTVRASYDPPGGTSRGAIAVIR